MSHSRNKSSSRHSDAPKSHRADGKHAALPHAATKSVPADGADPLAIVDLPNNGGVPNGDPSQPPAAKAALDLTMTGEGYSDSHSSSGSQDDAPPSSKGSKGVRRASAPADDAHHSSKRKRESKRPKHYDSESFDSESDSEGDSTSQDDHLPTDDELHDTIMACTNEYLRLEGPRILQYCAQRWISEQKKDALAQKKAEKALQAASTRAAKRPRK